MMPNEHAIQLLVVYSLLASSIGQSTVHFITYWALGKESDADPYGESLRKRELSLGLKMFFRIFFDMILVMVVRDGYRDIPVALRITVYIALSIAAVSAFIYGVRFINVLRTDNWGRPRMVDKETVDARDERQDRRAERQDRREERQDERAREQGVM